MKDGYLIRWRMNKKSTRVAKAKKNSENASKI